MSAFKLLPAKTYGPEFGMRESSRVSRRVVNFVLNDEGLGGLVNYFGATTWLAKNSPWIRGRVWVRQFLIPLAHDIHKEFPEWSVHPIEKFQKTVEAGTAVVGSGLAINNQAYCPQLVTAIGSHPFDVGFGYYMHTCPAPKDAYLPILDYPISQLPKRIKQLETKYIVVTVGHTTESRKVTGKHLNPIIAHIKNLGMTPVFLGKKDFLNDGKVSTFFADDIDYSQGLDLRDETTVKDAACILQHAQCTVGLDNGLLHLAALMKDSRIVFGYNITTVEHREPRRLHGKTMNISLRDNELTCSGCQSKWKQVPNHLFDKCFYGDNKCVELLFKDNSIRWINEINEVIK